MLHDAEFGSYAAHGAYEARPGKRLVIGNGAETEVNAGLVELIKEAFAIRNQFLSGSHDSIEAMSGRLGMKKGRLTSFVRLSYLGPEIVRALFAGSQSNALTPSRLLRLSKNLPHDWKEHPPRDMAIVVHFARLEPPGGEPNPGTHVARVLEVDSSVQAKINASGNAYQEDEDQRPGPLGKLQNGLQIVEELQQDPCHHDKGRRHLVDVASF
jgi:hypothetical protein